MHIYTYTYIYIHIYTNVYMYMYMYTYIQLHVYRSIQIYICIYMCIYLCTFILYTKYKHIFICFRSILNVFMYSKPLTHYVHISIICKHILANTLLYTYLQTYTFNIFHMCTSSCVIYTYICMYPVYTHEHMYASYISTQEASWWWGFDPVYTGLFHLYHQFGKNVLSDWYHN